MTSERTARPKAGSRRIKAYPAYKDSGVEWLADLPVNWEVAPIFARYELPLGKMLDSKRVPGEFFGPYLCTLEVQWDNLNAEGLPEMDLAPPLRGRYLLRRGDLLVSKASEVGRATLGVGKIDSCFCQETSSSKAIG